MHRSVSNNFRSMGRLKNVSIGISRKDKIKLNFVPKSTYLNIGLTFYFSIVCANIFNPIMNE